MAKKKKEPKVEKVFGDKSEVVQEKSENVVLDKTETSDVDEILGKEETPEDKLTEKQKKKLEKLNNVKNKISKILKTSNVEIVDENFDDDYDSGSAETIDGQSQQDYDSLKAIFGNKDKNKKQELTLTIDDFDYTYIGQYLEEYDLMHMKNIKKVKIQRKRSPKLKKFLIISSLVLIVGLGVALTLLFTRQTPVYLKSVSLNQTERSYYIDDTFDYTGLYLIAEYSDGNTKRIKLDSSYFNSELSTGKIERTGEENELILFANNGTANLVFSYEGFNVNYTVSVARKIEQGIHACYTEAVFNVGAGGLITDEMLKVFIDYENLGVSLVDFSQSILVYVDGVKCDYNSSLNGYKVLAGTHTSSIIKIKSGSYEITLDKSLNYI